MHTVGVVRLANDPKEYVIVKHFRGSKEDNELRVGGPVWCELLKRIRQSNGEDLGDLLPRKSRLVELPPHMIRKQRKKKKKPTTAISVCAVHYHILHFSSAITIIVTMHMLALIAGRPEMTSEWK